MTRQDVTLRTVRIFPVNNDMSSFQGSAQRRQLISNKQLPPRQATSLLREGVSAGRQGRGRGRLSKTGTVSSSRLQGHGTKAWRVFGPWRPPALPWPGNPTAESFWRVCWRPWGTPGGRPADLSVCRSHVFHLYTPDQGPDEAGAPDPDASFPWGSPRGTTMSTT